MSQQRFKPTVSRSRSTEMDKPVAQPSASVLYDENDQYNEHIIGGVVMVCSGLTSLSTIFQSYHDGVWLRQGAQCSLSLCCIMPQTLDMIPHPVTLS